MQELLVDDANGLAQMPEAFPVDQIPLRMHQFIVMHQKTAIRSILELEHVLNARAAIPLANAEHSLA